MQILAEIKEKLEKLELEIFRRSCFRHFLDLDASWIEWWQIGQEEHICWTIGPLLHVATHADLEKAGFMVLGGEKTG